MIDIGGGSTEMVTFKNKEIQKAVSIPIGSLNLFLKNVPTLLPTESGIKKIKQDILFELKKIDFFGK